MPAGNLIFRLCHLRGRNVTDSSKNTLKYEVNVSATCDSSGNCAWHANGGGNLTSSTPAAPPEGSPCTPAGGGSGVIVIEQSTGQAQCDEARVSRFGSPRRRGRGPDSRARRLDRASLGCGCRRGGWISSILADGGGARRVVASRVLSSRAGPIVSGRANRLDCGSTVPVEDR
jgi:hypothetical protein